MESYGSIAGSPTPLGVKSQARYAPFGWSARLPWYPFIPSKLRTDRKRLNGCAVIVNVLVPWLVFCAVFALTSFIFRWHHPLLCWLAVAVVFVISVGGSALLATLKAKKVKNIDADVSEPDPMWYWFFCSTCFLASLAGILLGSVNYSIHMLPLYTLQSLNTYQDVNPALFVGQQLVDAGRIQFSHNTYLDASKSMGFKDKDVYCVAPIVSPNTTKKTYLDFWAVGKGCCSPTRADFHCRGHNDLQYNGGLRLMNDAERPFYRLAVQQAEATYNIVTHKPLFFMWSTDTIDYGNDLQRSGMSMYTNCVIAALVVQAFLVLAATLIFVKKLMPSR